MEVDSPGGLLVLRRAFQPLYRATSAGRPLATLPVDLALLGVELPPGRHRVVLAVPAGPEVAAAVAAAAALAAALALGLWPARPRARGSVA